jgi:hypothetical protein
MGLEIAGGGSHKRPGLVLHKDMDRGPAGLRPYAAGILQRGQEGMGYERIMGFVGGTVGESN